MATSSASSSLSPSGQCHSGTSSDTVITRQILATSRIYLALAAQILGRGPSLCSTQLHKYEGDFVHTTRYRHGARSAA